MKSQWLQHVLPKFHAERSWFLCATKTNWKPILSHAVQHKKSQGTLWRCLHGLLTGMYFLGRWPWPTLCGGWVRITNCILDMHLSVLWCAHHQRCVHDGEAKTMHKATQTQTQTHTHTHSHSHSHTHTPTNTNSVKHLTSKPLMSGCSQKIP